MAAREAPRSPTAGAPRNEPTTARRACDSCYALKEKCFYADATSGCYRCCRLKKKCTDDRPMRQSGRPRRDRPVQRGICKRATMIAAKPSPMLPPFGLLSARLDPTDEYLLVTYMEPQDVGDLMVAPRIGDEMFQQAVQCLLTNYDDFRDGFLSLYGSYLTALGVEVPGYTYEKNIRQGTRALAKFSSWQLPQDHQAFVPWLWLGVMILLHGHCVLGSNNAPVRRYILTYLKQLGASAKNLILHPVIVSQIALDIQDSLMLGQVPILNMPERFEQPFRYEILAGLCPEMFRFLHELCGILASRSASVDATEVVEARSSDLLTRIEAWHPLLSPEVLGELTSTEAIHIQTQVRVYKSAIKLFIHRLRHPFSEDDETAHAIALSIFADLDLATALSGEAPSLVTLPFLIAAIETWPADRERINRDISVFVDGITPVVHARNKDFLNIIWRRRDSGQSFKWIDIMDELPELGINRVGGRKKARAGEKVVPEQDTLQAG